MNDQDMYLSGNILYGDDFNIEQIKSWYRDEEEAYADLGSKDKATYKYVYHALNTQHGYRYIKNRVFNNVFGLGSAYGDELLPIIDNIKNITISDPSGAFINEDISGVPCTYIKPTIDGILPFNNSSFDLITCFGVLHHIPNISTVINEFYRCLSKDGIALIREPIVSMGDWRKPRPGLTKRERGIPYDIFQNIIIDSGFKIVRNKLCVFPPLPRIIGRMNLSVYNSRTATIIDSILCDMFRWNIRYHASKYIHKLRPASVFYVLMKK